MSQMTISQALRQAKKLKGQLAVYQARVTSSVYHAADITPAYSTHDSLSKMSDVADALSELETKIALANASTFVEGFFGSDKKTLAYAVRCLQSLKSDIAFFKGLNCHPQENMYVIGNEYNDAGQYRSTKIAWKCELTESQRDGRVEALQSKFDTLNDIVERINGSTPLVD
ncbi:MAG TPA: hypothetical protein VIE65_17385 [Methylobacter sp.]|jgi:hypothetical protein